MQRCYGRFSFIQVQGTQILGANWETYFVKFTSILKAKVTFLLCF